MSATRCPGAKRSANRQRAKLLGNLTEWAEHELLVVRAAAPEKSNEGRAARASGPHAGAAVAATHDRRAGGVGHEALAEEIDARARHAGVHTAPCHDALRPAGGAADLVDCRTFSSGARRAADRDGARDGEAAVVRAGRGGDLSQREGDAARVRGTRRVAVPAHLPLGARGA